MERGAFWLVWAFVLSLMEGGNKRASNLESFSSLFSLLLPRTVVPTVSVKRAPTATCPWALVGGTCQWVGVHGAGSSYIVSSRVR
jgi:hypothetical protein